jgi:hypothetical protein
MAAGDAGADTTARLTPAGAAAAGLRPARVAVGPGAGSGRATEDPTSAVADGRVK